ncbi:MAG: hypothetical protein HY465_05345 [Deltaproteobacteria bacterium]|nr:hypothetical protein [Deltaproteobacteria bacterium]
MVSGGFDGITSFASALGEARAINGMSETSRMNPTKSPSVSDNNEEARIAAERLRWLTQDPCTSGQWRRAATMCRK